MEDAITKHKTTRASLNGPHNRNLRLLQDVAAKINEIHSTARCGGMHQNWTTTE